LERSASGLTTEDVWAGVELYREELYRYLALGGLVALLVHCLSVFFFSYHARRRLWIAAQIVSFLIATIALWFAIIYGVGKGFDAWQGSSGHGENAYVDGAQLTGSVLFGWIPAGIGSFSIWCLLTLGKKLLGRAPEPAA
jgi:hypothetical protein